MITPIEKAARQEQAAEKHRAQAEAAWRAAWWQTTLALGAPPDSDRQQVTSALDTAQRILGQSRSWLGSRRRTGRMLLTAAPAAAVHQLPPRLAIAYFDARADPVHAVRVLRDAEARQLSLRDFAAELGVQPQSWLREGEQGQRPVTAGQLRARPPSEQAALVLEALRDPAVARLVTRAPLRQPPAGAREHPHRPVAQPVPDPGKPDVLELLGSARDGVVRAFGLSVLRRLTGDPEALAALAALEAEAAFLRRYLEGDSVPEERLARVMNADG